MEFDLSHFALNGPLPKKQKPERQKPKTGRKFVKGPINLAWLARASALPGKSLHTGMALWYLAGLTKSRTVKLASATAKIFSIDRHSLYRALRKLEKAGLISVKRHRGRAPMVTILDVEITAPQECP